MKLAEILNYTTPGEPPDHRRIVDVAVDEPRRAVIVFSKGLAAYEDAEVVFSYHDIQEQLPEAKAAKYFPEFQRCLSLKSPWLLAETTKDRDYFFLRSMINQGKQFISSFHITSGQFDLDHWPRVSDSCKPLLHEAVRFCPSVIGDLLTAGADPDIRDDKGFTALHRVCSLVGPVEVVRQLLSGGAAPDPVSDNGWTPLAQAVQHHNPEMVGLLLSAGADPFAGGNMCFVLDRLAAETVPDEKEAAERKQVQLQIRLAQGKRIHARNIARLDRLRIPRKGGNGP